MSRSPCPAASPRSRSSEPLSPDVTNQLRCPRIPASCTRARIAMYALERGRHDQRRQALFSVGSSCVHTHAARARQRRGHGRRSRGGGTLAVARGGERVVARTTSPSVCLVVSGDAHARPGPKTVIDGSQREGARTRDACPSERSASTSRACGASARISHTAQAMSWSRSHACPLLPCDGIGTSRCSASPAARAGGAAPSQRARSTRTGGRASSFTAPRGRTRRGSSRLRRTRCAVTPSRRGSRRAPRVAVPSAPRGCSAGTRDARSRSCRGAQAIHVRGNLR